jgi:hypothetical protein
MRPPGMRQFRSGLRSRQTSAHDFWLNWRWAWGGNYWGVLSCDQLRTDSPARALGARSQRTTETGCPRIRLSVRVSASPWARPSLLAKCLDANGLARVGGISSHRRNSYQPDDDRADLRRATTTQPPEPSICRRRSVHNGTDPRLCIGPFHCIAEPLGSSGKVSDHPGTGRSSGQTA